MKNLKKQKKNLKKNVKQPPHPPKKNQVGCFFQPCECSLGYLMSGGPLTIE